MKNKFDSDFVEGNKRSNNLNSRSNFLHNITELTKINDNQADNFKTMKNYLNENNMIESKISTDLNERTTHKSIEEIRSLNCLNHNLDKENLRSKKGRIKKINEAKNLNFHSFSAKTLQYLENVMKINEEKGIPCIIDNYYNSEPRKKDNVI